MKTIILVLGLLAVFRSAGLLPPTPCRNRRRLPSLPPGQRSNGLNA